MTAFIAILYILLALGGGWAFIAIFFYTKEDGPRAFGCTCVLVFTLLIEMGLVRNFPIS